MTAVADNCIVRDGGTLTKADESTMRIHSKLLACLVLVVSTNTAFAQATKKWTTLDPKGPTYIGRVLTGSTCTVQVKGEWCPHRSTDPDRFFGPEGSKKDKLGGLPKWSALVFAVVEGKEETYDWDDLPDGMKKLSGVKKLREKLDGVLHISVSTGGSRIADYGVIDENGEVTLSVDGDHGA